MMNILYSLDTVIIKMASLNWERAGLLTPSTLACFFVAGFGLAIYALLWQKILGKVDLTVAYMCKGMIIFWGMIWAALFFKENITFFNLLGTAFIFCGAYLVTVNE